MPAVRTIEVVCPDCNNILIVNRENGQVLEVRKPLVDKPSGDRFADALQAQIDRDKDLTNLFEASVAEVAKQASEREQLFKDGLDKVKKEGLGDFKKLRDIDLD